MAAGEGVAMSGGVCWILLLPTISNSDAANDVGPGRRHGMACGLSLPPCGTEVKVVRVDSGQPRQSHMYTKYDSHAKFCLPVTHSGPKISTIWNE